MLKEFKAFIMKGNVLELAVAVIIAAAFGAVVSSFTNDVLGPIIGQAMGGMDFSELAFPLSADTVGPDGEVVAGASIKYGMFIQKIIDFIIVGFILFMIVRSYNKMNAPAEEAPAPDPGPSETDLLAEIRDLLAKR